MKKLLAFCMFFSFLSPQVALLASSAESSSEEGTLIPWMTKYEQAIAEAKQANKPLFLYFTGSDWCGWCKKMDKEILSSRDFFQMVGEKFVFVKIDFPLYQKLDKELRQQNEELKHKFDIRGFPTILLLSSEGKQMAILNYRQGGGKAYAEYLLRLLQEQEDFKRGMQSLNTQNQEGLKKLFEQATQYGFNDDAKAIIQAALAKEESIFFLTEQYRNFLNEGKMASPEVQLLRQKLLSKDPENKDHVHYNIAIIDFEAHAENLPDEPTADKTVQPLKHYLTKFGHTDPQNRWRIEMTISQVYSGKEQYKEAMQFAKASLTHAPEEMKNTIAQAVIGLEQSLSNIGSADK